MENVDVIRKTFLMAERKKNLVNEMNIFKRVSAKRKDAKKNKEITKIYNCQIGLINRKNRQ